MSQCLKVSRSQDLKVQGLKVLRSQGGGLRCPIGSTGEFDGSSVEVALEHSRVLAIFCSMVFTSDHPLYNVHIVYSQYMGGLK